MNADKENIYQKHMLLVIENQYLKLEVELIKELITKGVLDSHSYILGYNDCKASMQSEIENWKNACEGLDLACKELSRTHEKYCMGITNPSKELNDGGEPVKNAAYWKRQYNEMSALNDRLKSSLYHANEQIKYLEASGK